MSLLTKIKKLFSTKKEKNQSSEVVQYNKNPSDLEVILDGEYVYYDNKDESLLIKNYKDGKLNGPSYFHYVSGELWIEEHFQDGLIHGTTKYYDKDGSIIFGLVVFIIFIIFLTIFNLLYLRFFNISFF